MTIYGGSDVSMSAGSGSVSVSSATGTMITAGGSVSVTGGSDVALRTSGSGQITFETNAGSVSIDSKGDVHMGTSTQNSKLFVAGDAEFTGSVFANDFVAPSDRRLKTNIQPLTGVLARLEKLTGVRYQWNQLARESVLSDRKANATEVGLIAQDVEAVFPELVHTWYAQSPDGTSKSEYKAVDYSRLTAVLVEAVREQQAKIDKLDAAVAQLTQIVQTLVEKGT